MVGESAIKITSWNIRGLNKLIKLKQVLGRIRLLKFQIIFLQESHLTDLTKVKRRWPGQVFAASFNSQARGVIILIHISIPFRLSHEVIDPAGRYIILQRTILTSQITLVNVYGPNVDNPTFLRNLFLTMSTPPGQYIIGGDCNCVLDPLKDRSTGADASHSDARKVLLYSINDLYLIEVWRKLHPNKKEFSCYSNTYKTSSRIDYFLISMSLLPHVNECAYDSIVLSDHASMSLTLYIPGIVRCPPRWRLQTKWLQDPKFVKFLGDNIDNYFCMNTDQTSAGTRWEAFKAFIRGVMISYTDYKSKSHYRNLIKLEAQIKALELDLYQNDSPEKHKELFLLRTRYKELSNTIIAANLLWLKQSYYDQGDKAGKLLAWRIKKNAIS